MALAGALLRSGWSEEETQKFIEIVAGLAGDEETRDRLRAAEYTAKKFGASPTTGWKRLSELLGEEVIRLVMEWLQVKKEKEETAETGIKIWTDTELWNADLPEPSWLVEGLIPETGLILLAGKPKIGKSWLALDIATGLAKGGEVAGIQAERQANTLYFALEDTPRRLKKRLKIIEEEPSGKCRIATHWGKITPESLQALEKEIQGKNIKALIIDPLEKMKPKGDKNANLYSAEYEILGALKDLADRLNIAIIVIHHLRKGEVDDPLEAVLGTTAIIGAVDTILVLKRTRGEADATLFVTGREIEDKEVALEFEAGKWKVIGDAREVAITREEKKVLQALRELGGVASPKEIAELAEMNPNTVKTALRRLAGENKVKVVDRGKYTLENDTL
jgi:DNA-binding CsgD family transcriptional regulator